MSVIRLTRPHVEARARSLLLNGGDCSDYEILERVVAIAQTEHQTVSFYRDEDGPCEIDLEMMVTAIVMNLEMRPRDSTVQAART